MSRLSKAVRKMGLGSVITTLVKLAEAWIGGGNGAVKKQLVLDLTKAITKAFSAAGVKTPEPTAELIEELIETNVALLNETGAFTHAAEAVATPAQPVKRRPRVSKNTPAVDENDVDLTAVELEDESED